MEPYIDLQDKIKHQLRVDKIAKMIKPTILMNEDYFDLLKKEVESMTNVIVGVNPQYEGIPVKTSHFLQKGNIVIYDDYFNLGFQYSNKS